LFENAPEVWKAITVRHLLTHTSGIPDYNDGLLDYRKDYSEDDLVKFAMTLPLDFTPGSEWKYSNTGYQLLGIIVGKVSGTFYGNVLRDRVFKPLGMTTARIISEADIVPNRAGGYRLERGELRNQEWVSPSLNTTADGALYLTVNDLAKWALALKQQRVPGSRVLNQAWTPVRLVDGGTFPYGYGWSLTPQRSHRRIGHTGSWQGFKAAIYRYPEQDLSVVVLANLAEATPGPIAQGIAGIVEPALRPPEMFSETMGGPRPPVEISALLRGIVTGNQAGIAPGARRHLVPAARRQLPEILKEAQSWTALGCERPLGGRLRLLGADAVHVCYARAIGRPAERTVATVYFTGDWQVAYFDLERY
jgi:CubicO group peptidase (beta-lactamase class C family)